MIAAAAAGSVICIILFFVFGLGGLIAAGTLKTVLTVIFLVGAVVCAIATLWMWMMYRAFSYNGKRQMSRQIIDGVAAYISLPEGGQCLDVGCGSGALAIAVAKRNQQASVTGIDRWGTEYASYNKKLCEENAGAEGVAERVIFAQGNAVHLNFPDESFDSVCSNYVYHNIPSLNRQEILLETLRVLKKGGSFAIHDIFSKQKYGDMQKFVQRLKDMGYAEVELIPTDNGIFMTRREAVWLMLKGSAILVGKK